MAVMLIFWENGPQLLRQLSQAIRGFVSSSGPRPTLVSLLPPSATQYKYLLERMKIWPSLMAGVALKSPPEVNWFCREELELRTGGVNIRGARAGKVKNLAVGQDGRGVVLSAHAASASATTAARSAATAARSAELHRPAATAAGPPPPPPAEAAGACRRPPRGHRRRRLLHRHGPFPRGRVRR